VGGAPRDVRNLWPEPITSARVKDRVENAAHAAVCAAHDPMPLATAQQGMATNWIALGRQLRVPGL
jgi:hypothetical protein